MATVRIWLIDVVRCFILPSYLRPLGGVSLSCHHSWATGRRTNLIVSAASTPLVA
jgi:hypothetical protein